MKKPLKKQSKKVQSEPLNERIIKEQKYTDDEKVSIEQVYPDYPFEDRVNTDKDDELDDLDGNGNKTI